MIPHPILMGTADRTITAGPTKTPQSTALPSELCPHVHKSRTRKKKWCVPAWPMNREYEWAAMCPRAGIGDPMVPGNVNENPVGAPAMGYAGLITVL